MKRYLVLAGNIGAGKTTLVRMLCARLGWKPYYEPVSENPYLADFYRDMSRWAFPSQIYFLTHRVRAQRELAGDPWSVVQDRSLYEDAEVFARNLYVRGSMSERDWACYRDLYRTVAGLLPSPDLVVYLRASVGTLRARIRERGRGFEAGITDTYLEELNTLYEQWVASFDLAPVLAIPADEMDFVAREAHFERILALVEERLREPQGQLFPDLKSAPPTVAGAP